MSETSSNWCGGRSRSRCNLRALRSKKNSPARQCGCGLKKAHHGCKRRSLVTQAGEISVSRIYLRCVKCGAGGYPVDERLGIDGRYSKQAQRLMCLAAASWSYDISSDRLKDFRSLSVSGTTIREVAQEHGSKANEWLRTEPVAVQAFREARGDIEFTADGTCVNTVDGWREMKVGIFSKRERGESATPDEWATRDLPKPHTRIAFAAIENSDSFGSRWKAWRKRLGLADTSAITILARWRPVAVGRAAQTPDSCGWRTRSLPRPRTHHSCRTSSLSNTGRVDRLDHPRSRGAAE